MTQSKDERIVLHISKYKDPNPEKALIKDILFYFEQSPLTFGWHTTSIAVYDIKGNRCLLYNLDSPFEIGYNGNYIE